MFTPAASLNLGPLTIYWYSVFILTGIAGGYWLARPAARRINLKNDDLQLSLLYGIIPGVIGARLYHVIDQWPLYAGQPLQMLAVWNGGLGILGGLAGGAFGLWLFARRRRIRLLSLLDVWAPSVLLAQAIGRFGNWTNQEAFGPPTDLPWKLYIDPEHRPLQYLNTQYFHPTFFYEAGLNLLGLLMLLKLRPQLMKQPGKVLGAYLIIYAIGRFTVEFFRFDTAHLGPLATAHLAAIGLAALGAYLLIRPTKEPGRPPARHDARAE